MKKLLAALAFWAVACAQAQAPAAPAQRVVALGGAITEIVYALDAGHRLVGVDDSSIYPAAAKRLPKVGYYRGFSIEGVAALRPDVILASDQAGPPAAFEQLKRLGKRVVVLPSEPSVEALERRILASLGIGDPYRRRADFAP